jgi:hypothetical protein
LGAMEHERRRAAKITSPHLGKLGRRGALVEKKKERKRGHSGFKK